MVNWIYFCSGSEYLQFATESQKPRIVCNIIGGNLKLSQSNSISFSLSCILNQVIFPSVQGTLVIAFSIKQNLIQYNYLKQFKNKGIIPHMVYIDIQISGMSLSNSINDDLFPRHLPHHCLRNIVQVPRPYRWILKVVQISGQWRHELILISKIAGISITADENANTSSLSHTCLWSGSETFYLTSLVG